MLTFPFFHIILYCSITTTSKFSHSRVTAVDPDWEAATEGGKGEEEGSTLSSEDVTEISGSESTENTNTRKRGKKRTRRIAERFWTEELVKRHM